MREQLSKRSKLCLVLTSSQTLVRTLRCQIVVVRAVKSSCVTTVYECCWVTMMLLALAVSCFKTLRCHSGSRNDI
jgi:hypothetical protein